MNHSESRHSPCKCKQYHVGIKWKMYFILILFIGVVVGVIWFFQIRMLNWETDLPFPFPKCKENHFFPVCFFLAKKMDGTFRTEFNDVLKGFVFVYAAKGMKL